MSKCTCGYEKLRLNSNVLNIKLENIFFSWYRTALSTSRNVWKYMCSTVHVRQNINCIPPFPFHSCVPSVLTVVGQLCLHCWQKKLHVLCTVYSTKYLYTYSTIVSVPVLRIRSVNFRQHFEIYLIRQISGWTVNFFLAYNGQTRLDFKVSYKKKGQVHKTGKIVLFFCFSKVHAEDIEALLYFTYLHL